MGIKWQIGEKELYRLGNAGLLTLFVLFGAGQYFGLAAPSGRHVWVVLLVLLLLTGISLLNKRGRLFALLSAAVCLAVVMIAVGGRATIVFLQNYVWWLTGSEGAIPGNGMSSAGEATISSVASAGGVVSAGGMAGWVVGYELLQSGLLAVSCYLLQLFLEKVPLCKRFLAVFLFADLLFCLLTKRVIGHLGVVLMISYLVMVAAEEVQSHWEKVKSRSQRAHMIWTAPVLAAYFLLLFLMPAPDNPYDWSWVQNIYTQMKESFVIFTQDTVRGDREDFGMAFSGFSGEGELQEGFREDTRAVMSIQGAEELRTNLYLTGRVYDSFDGRQWRQEAEGFPQERFLDTAETLYAARSFDGQHVRDYLYRTKLTLRYGYFNTGYVFQPLKVWELNSGKGLHVSEQGGSLVFGDQEGYGTEYGIEYFQMNLGQTEFIRFLDTVGNIDRDTTGEAAGHLKTGGRDNTAWNQVSLEYERRTGEKMDEETLRQYRAYIYETYLPDTDVSDTLLSARTEEYLAEITENAQTKTELLLAIEQELASFAYTRTPGEMPESVMDKTSFLDYFLCDSQQGYCTYFATAFVLLARAVGIPARYIEGFLVPDSTSAVYGADGELLVFSSMAHAWPEVYLDGIGWIPFEPTPGYGSMRYTPWKTSQSMADETVTESSEAGTDGTEGRPEEPWDRFFGTELTEEKNPEEADEKLLEEEIRENAGINWSRVRQLLAVLGITLVAILVMGVLLLLCDSLIRRFRYRKMKPEERLRTELFYNLQVLTWLGLKTQTSQAETLQELQERGRQLLRAEKVSLSLQSIGYYEEAVYGGRNVEEEMLAEARQERKVLMTLLKQKKGWRGVFYQIRVFLM